MLKRKSIFNWKTKTFSLLAVDWGVKLIIETSPLSRPPLPDPLSTPSMTPPRPLGTRTHIRNTTTISATNSCNGSTPRTRPPITGASTTLTIGTRILACSTDLSYTATGGNLFFFIPNIIPNIIQGRVWSYLLIFIIYNYCGKIQFFENLKIIEKYPVTKLYVIQKIPHEKWKNTYSLEPYSILHLNIAVENAFLNSR